MLFLKPKKKDKGEVIKKAAPQNPKILEVNLIKGEVRIAFDWRRNISILVLTLVIAGAFIAEIYFGLDLWAKQEEARAKVLADEITRLSDEVKDTRAKAESALEYKDKSIEVSRLIDNHVYWSSFFDWLEKNTLSTVKFSGFDGTTDGIYTLQATASSYQDASWQVKALLDDPLVKKASITDVSSGEEEGETPEGEVISGKKTVSFVLELEVSPEIFKK